jgi:Zn-dependent protease
LNGTKQKIKGTFKLRKVAGIDLFMYWTFSLLIVFVIYINYRTGYNAIQILWSVVFVLCIFIKVVMHELGRALAAKNYRIQTRDITLQLIRTSAGKNKFYFADQPSRY